MVRLIYVQKLSHKKDIIHICPDKMRSMLNVEQLNITQGCEVMKMHLRALCTEIT